MDEIFSKEKLQIAIPILFGVIYFSAFKNGKQTCDRYFTNYFLYLLTSLAVYFYSSNELDFGITKNAIKGLVAVILLFGLIIAVFKSEDMCQLLEKSLTLTSGRFGWVLGEIANHLSLFNLEFLNSLERR